MLITTLGGITSFNDTALAASDKIECIFEADGAISVGMTAAHDSGNTLGTLVVAVPIGTQTTLDHTFCGIYEGRGNATGTTTTVSNLSGRAAADGDVIYVTTYGRALALVDGGSTNVADLDPLTVNIGIAGWLQCIASAAFDVGDHPAFLALAAQDSSTTATPVFVKCM